MRLKIALVLSLLFFLAGCETIQTPLQGNSLSSPEARQFLQELNAREKATQKKVWRYAASLYIVDKNGTSRKVSALALWQPGEKVRWRLKYLGQTFFSALCDGQSWWLFQEGNGTVYRLPKERVSDVRAEGIPPLAWHVLGRSLTGFRPEATEALQIFKNENSFTCYTKKGDGEESVTFASEVEAGYPPLPLEGLWQTAAGERCQATFEKASFVSGSDFFAVTTNNYRVVEL